MLGPASQFQFPLALHDDALSVSCCFLVFVSLSPVLFPSPPSLPFFGLFLVSASVVWTSVTVGKCAPSRPWIGRVGCTFTSSIERVGVQMPFIYSFDPLKRLTSHVILP